MAQYDGSIRINTEILVKSAEKQLKALENNMEKTATKAASFRAEMDALKNEKIPTQEYKDISKEIEKAEQNLIKLTDTQARMSNEGKTSGVAWERLNLQIQSTREVIEDAKSDLQNLVKTGKAFTLGSSTERYAELGRKIKETDDSLEIMNQQHKILEDRLAAAIQKRDKEKEKIKESVAEEQRLSEIKANAIVSDQELINLLERRKELLKEIAELERAGVTQGYQENDVARQELSSVNSRIKAIQQERASTEEIRASYVRLGDVVKNSFKLMGKGLMSIPISTVKKGIRGLLSVFLKIGKVVRNSAITPFRLMGNVAKSAFSKITKHANRSGGSISKFGRRIKEIVSSFFIFNQIRKIFTSTINGLKDGFSNLYGENTKFKSPVDNLKASVLTLKNALASAFSPIVETAIPYIQRLVEWATRAADAVGQLIASLMGRKTYTKAIKQTAKASEDAADATKKEAEATEEAEEAAEGYLNPLDEINKNKEEEVKNSKKTTPEEIEESPVEQIGNMFEEVPISDKFKDISQWLKDMWANADFTELGTLLGKKLKNALDNIPWDGIKETAGKIGKSIATLINGFVEVAGLGITIGKTLAEAINTGFEFLNNFVHNLHWESIGKFIADTISGFFQNIDWDLIYDTFVTGAKGLGDAINSFMDNLDWNAISTSVSNFVNTFVDTIYTFITTVDWKKLGNKVGTTISNAWKGINWSKAGATISEVFKAFFDFVGQAIEAVDWWSVGESVKDFLVGIDWAGVAEAFFEAIGAALGGLASFLGGLISDGVSAAIEYFREKIEECGGNIVFGIFKGISDAIRGVSEWIVEHILFPFIEGFKNAFGIHSPSTVMAELGVYIIQGLINGIKSLIPSVQEIWEGMKETAINIWNGLKEKLSDTWSSIKQTAVQTWDGIKQNLTEKWNNLKSSAKTTFEAIGKNIKESWSSIKSNVKESAENVKTNISNAWEKTKEVTSSTWSGIKERAVSSVQSMAGSIREKYSSIQSAISSFSSNAQNLWARAWEGMQSKVSSVLSSISNTVSSVFGWISSTISSLGNSMKNLVSGVFSPKRSFSSSRFVSAAPSVFSHQNPAFASLRDVEIPGYATGQVIPRTMRQHLAILGDNNRETEVVSPLSTIKQALREEAMSLGLSGNGGIGNKELTIRIPVIIDGKQITEIVLNNGMIQQMSTGKNPFSLGTT